MRHRSAWLRGEPVIRSAGFSLLEVVAAVGIFAVGMVAVLGMFAPVANSAATLAEAEAAAGVADAVRARLRALPFDRALGLIQDPADVREKDGSAGYNPNDGTYPAVLFGERGGNIGIYDHGDGRHAWYDASVPTPRRVEDADKFFEIDLIRNDALTPKTADATAAVVVYTLRVRWPAFVRASNGAAIQVGANPGGGGPVSYDHGRKQVLFFAGSIQR